MSSLLINLYCLMVFLYIINILYLWKFIISYRDEIRTLYDKIEEMENHYAS